MASFASARHHKWHTQAAWTKKSKEPGLIGYIYVLCTTRISRRYVPNILGSLAHLLALLGNGTNIWPT